MGRRAPWPSPTTPTARRCISRRWRWTGAGAQLTLSAAGPLLSRRDRTVETGLRLLRAFRLDAGVKGFLALRLNELPGRPELLADFGVDLTPEQARALLEVTPGVGAHVTRDDNGPFAAALEQRRAARLRPSRGRDSTAEVVRAPRSSSGPVPRFLAVRPEAG